MRYLPDDAATMRALYPESIWTAGDYLLAGVLDALNVANWLTVEVNKRKGTRNPMPEPVPRPGQSDRRERRGSAPLITASELADWLTKVG